MRLIVRNCLPFGNFATQAIEIDLSKHNISYLRRLIQARFKVAPSRQILKFLREGFYIRIVDEFSLDFYELTENTILIVEPIEQKQNANTKYFDKLNILQPVNEDQEDLQTSIDSHDSNEDIFLQDDHILREKLLKQLTLRNLESIKALVEESESLGQNSIDSIGNQGWNALHCAVYQGYDEAVSYFLSKGADSNKQTQDGWTPLQLSIKKTRLSIFNLLMKHKTININEFSQKGTALHIALIEQQNEMAEQLINSGCDLSICTHDDIPCIELTNDINLTNLIKCKLCRRDSLQAPLIVGSVKTIRFLMFKVYNQYLVCDPWMGTLRIFKSKSQFPMEHTTNIFLTEIRSLQKLKNQWFAPNYFFIEIIYSHRIMLAFDHEQTAQKWLDKIYQASVFQKLLLDFFKNIQNENDQITRVQELNDIHGYQELEIVDSSIINQEVDQYCKLFYKRFTNSCHQYHSLQPQTDNLKQHSPIQPKTPNKQQAQLKDFKVLEILGAGAFGTVYKVIHLATQNVYAMKALKKRNLIIKKQLRFAVTEANILKESNHPFVLQMHFAFQTPQNLYLVTDYCAGKDLSFLIASRVKLSEKEAIFYIAEIIIAINYLHKKDILYRDLKPENILINADGHIKLADFGLSKENVGDQDLSKTFCGSPAYLAPEMVRKKGITKSADIYGVGCVWYEMLTGEAPFMDDDLEKLTRKIELGKLNFPSFVKEESKKAIRNLLDKDPKKRLQFWVSIENEPIFSSIDFPALERREIKPPIIDFNDEEFTDYQQVLNQQKEVRIMDKDYTKENISINRVDNFSFVR